jgi:hypothetical protein
MVSLVAVPICVTLAMDAGAELSGHSALERTPPSAPHGATDKPPD